MFEANCIEEQPADIVARVLEEQVPCFVTAREGVRGVLLPLDEVYTEVLELHSRVIDARMKDLVRPGKDMAMYCIQVSLSDEQDAIRFSDEEGEPVLALVGAMRFLRWMEESEEES
ncbi:hypothetical protein HUA78_27340 [Myxococcus sp. CA033]|uniref:hypothetical protein n=1 Tax=Myxococcus sp. CA033 TaxID=2741516 RepID=UPI00157B3021|nr:hypothetical protein [Myxococcus sp. CA033]NTX38166.1 hypothetical protein [Myxococcus sp. CA033]